MALKEEPRAFVVPIIDVIDDKTMEYYHGNGVYFQIGGFTWSGHFNWIDIPEVRRLSAYWISKCLMFMERIV